MLKVLIKHVMYEHAIDVCFTAFCKNTVPFSTLHVSIGDCVDIISTENTDHYGCTILSKTLSTITFKCISDARRTESFMWVLGAGRTVTVNWKDLTYYGTSEDTIPY